MTLTPIWALGWENGLLEGNAMDGSEMPTVSNTKTFLSNYSLRVHATSPYGRTAPNLTQLQIACYFNHNGVGTAGTSDANIFDMICADGSKFRVVVRGTILQLRGDSVVLDSLAFAGTQISTVNTWHAVSAALKINTSTGFFVFYDSSGNELLRFDGNTGSSPVVAALFGGQIPSTNQGFLNFAYFAHCRLFDATGEAAQPTSAAALLWSQANGNGQVSEWAGSDGNSTDNYLLVDDGVSPDEDTTHVKALSAGLDDQYTHAGFTLPTDWVPTRVWPTVIAKKTDAAVATTIQLGLWKSSTSADSAGLDLSTGYDMVQAPFSALPDASALTEANIEATEIRLVSSGAYA